MGVPNPAKSNGRLQTYPTHLTHCTFHSMVATRRSLQVAASDLDTYWALGCALNLEMPRQNKPRQTTNTFMGTVPISSNALLEAIGHTCGQGTRQCSLNLQQFAEACSSVLCSHKFPYSWELTCCIVAFGTWLSLLRCCRRSFLAHLQWNHGDSEGTNEYPNHPKASIE